MLPVTPQLQIVAVGGTNSGAGTLSCVFNSTIVTCHVAPFALGDVAQIHISVDALAGAPGSVLLVHNTATVIIQDTPNWIDPNTSNNYYSVDSNIITPA